MIRCSCVFTLRNELLFVLRNHTRTEHFSDRFRPVTLSAAPASRVGAELPTGPLVKYIILYLEVTITAAEQ